MKKIILNATVVGPEKLLLDHAVIINNDKIESVLPMQKMEEKKFLKEESIFFDARGGYIMPGFIDIHSDYIEGILQPRPTCLMDFEMGLRETEKQLLSHGVTTIYHSLSLMNVNKNNAKSIIRTKENLDRLTKLIKVFHEGYHLIRHRCHARYEIDNLQIYDYLVDLLNSGSVHLLSFMDHTPGQGQYQDIEVLRKSYPQWEAKLKEKTKEEILAEAKSKPVASHEMLKRLAAIAHEKNIPLASHDDHTIEKLALMKNEYNIKISEFPITMEVAKQAHKENIMTVVGAPNVMMGGSHSGNLSAIEAIKEGAAHILCSDYYPSSLLHAVFKLESDGICSLPNAVKMLTLNPAKAMGTDAEYGSIEPGKKADILFVKKINDKPMVYKCFIDGKTVLQFEYRTGETDKSLYKGEERAAS